MASLRDIAKRAGTSLSTVSLVLNNKDAGIRISEETRNVVLEAARELSYTPNIAARRLRSNKKAALTIGVVMPFDERLHVSARAIGQIRQALTTWPGKEMLSPVDVVIETYEGGSIAEVESLQGNSVYNGAFLINTLPRDEVFLAQTAPFSFPLAIMQRCVEGISWANVDHHKMGQLVATHLIELGHQMIAIVGPSIESSAVLLRLEGFKTFLKEEKGLEIRTSYQATGSFSEVGGYTATRSLLDKLKEEAKPYPTALFVLADVMAVGTLHALKEAGLKIPADVAVVAYDNDPAGSFTDPPLTTVEAGIIASAELATHMLLNQIHGLDSGPTTALLEAYLIPRASSGGGSGGSKVT